MKEEEIGRLMDAYKEGLGSCSKKPAPKRKSLMLLRGSMGLAATAAVALAIFFLLPKDAAAQAVERVGRALRSVKSMKITTYLTRSGKRRLASRTFFKNGMWRTEAFYGSPLQGFFLSRDNHILTSYDSLPHATLQPNSILWNDWSPSEDMGILDCVMEWETNFGNVGAKRAISLAESLPVNGRPTYKIVLTRPGETYSAEIIVDKATELPISSSYQFPGDFSTQEYAFNENLSDDLFSYNIGKPVLDLEKEQLDLGQKWVNPLAQVGTTKVRDVSITSDGTVWIAVSNDKFTPASPMPNDVRSDAQTSYVRYGRDLDVSAVWGKKRARINGEEVYVVGFIASDPNAELPLKVDVELAPRNQVTPNFGDSSPQAAAGGTRISLVPRREPGRFPGYFPTLDLDHVCFQLWPQIQSARAKHLADQKRWVEAGKEYEAAATACESFIRRLGTRELKEAIKCYEEANRPDLAAKAQARYDQLWRETH